MKIIEAIIYFAIFFSISSIIYSMFLYCENSVKTENLEKNNNMEINFKNDIKKEERYLDPYCYNYESSKNFYVNLWCPTYTSKEGISNKI